MAASGSLPKKNAEEMIQRLAIGYSTLDEFTQHRYLHILEQLYKGNRFDVVEYQAYSMLLFQMGRTDEALTIIEEGLRKSNSLTLLGISVLEKMVLWQRNEYNLDLEKEFFRHPANPNTSSLTFSVEIAAVMVNDQYIPFETPLMGDVELSCEDGLTAYVGPYIIEQDYTDAEALRFSHQVIAEPILESYLLHRLTADEQKYLEQSLGTTALQQLQDCAHEHKLYQQDIRIWNIGPGKWIGYSKSKSAAVFGTTHEEALQYFKKYYLQVGA